METTNINIPQTTPQYVSPPSSPQMQFKDFLIFVLFIALILSILGINIFAWLGGLMQYITNLLKPLMASLGYATGTVINTTADLTSDTAKFGVDVAEGTIHNIGNLLISASDKNAIPDFKQQYNKYTATLMNNVSKAVAANPLHLPPVASPSTTPINVSAPMMAPVSAPMIAPVSAPMASPVSVPMIAPMASPITISPISIPVPVPVPVSVATPAKTLDDTINTPPPKYLKDVSADAATSNIQTTPMGKKSNWCLIGEYKDRRGCVEIDDADRCISGQIFPSQQMCLNPTFNQASSQTYIFNDSSTSYDAIPSRSIESNQIFYT